MPSYPEGENVLAEADYGDKLPEYLVRFKQRLWDNGREVLKLSPYKRELDRIAGLEPGRR